jgi:hypothetical protein
LDDLTVPARFHRLASVQRVLAIVIGIAVVGAAGQLSRLHIHAYSGHGHPEHQHGLASHAHEQAPRPIAADEDERPHVESCEAARHVVSFTVGCTPALTIVPFYAHIVDAPALAPALTVHAAATLTDVRVHGPPATRTLPARAPPQQPPA